MDFGLSQCIRRHELSDSPLKKVWVFSTFFFTMLEDKGINAVCKWSAHWNVFEQELIVVPVNEDFHWYIILILLPNSSFAPPDLDPIGAPCAQIFSLDSLGGKQCEAHELIENWLQIVAKPKLSGRQWITLDSRSLQVPKQPNFYDCGPFSIHNLGRFLMHYPDIVNLAISSASHEWDRIWHPHLASRMRKNLRLQMTLRRSVTHQEA
ncbi:hypothetical protein M422DRAFT_780231 [Sphaerobolus stellatus SS14]|uniref:Ubiquitin-like protease family profile domain-containing protein n=1 Tax=Sphaerobolus stellatus (strain SS14) TaxID=990650 RepID=A0A0C9V3X7_SPHS4|nr:hypothetical protein M422DRAFT_780231 [Sphaerobolus stellatus SS14]